MSAHDDELRRFLRHYEPFVRAYVRRRIDEAMVAELVAEVFAIAWRRWADMPDNALPWLYRTAHNVIGTRYRTQDRQRALHDKLAAVPIELPPDPAEAVVHRERLLAALTALSDDDRELLLLVAWEGLTTTDVAAALEISAGAAAVRLHRARQRLRALVGADQEEIT